MNPISDYVDVHLSLREAVCNKRCQYRERNLTFKYERDASREFVFLRGNYSDFCRWSSNLLNNAAEAIGDKPGVVNVGFRINGGGVEIRIKDNGAGMPRETTERLMSGALVGSTKPGGLGIGMRQILGTTEAMDGSMLIESQENVGTEFIFTFPRSEIPFWFADKIVFRKGAIIVALDDDPTTLVVWEDRFREFLGEIELKCFARGSEAIGFFNSLSEKEKKTVLFLTDYDLRGEPLNGSDIIELCGMENRSIIATSAYLVKIKGFEEKCYYYKVLAKPYLDEIPLIME